MPVRKCPCSHINQKRSLRSLASLGKRKKQPNTGSGQGTSARFGISWFGCQWGDVWAWLCMIALKSRIINLPSDSVHVGETSGSDLASCVDPPPGRRLWWSQRIWVVCSFYSCYDSFSATIKEQKKQGGFSGDVLASHLSLLSERKQNRSEANSEWI